MVKTATGTGANFNVSVPNSTSKPNGDGGKAPSGSSIPSVPSFGGDTGVPTQKLDATSVPNKLSKQGGGHGGTVSPGPGPLTKGFPGIPEKTTIPNR